MTYKHSSQAIIERFQGEALYKSIFEHCQDGIFVCCLNDDGQFGNFIEVNGSFCQRIGYTKAELLGLTPLDLFMVGQSMLLAVINRLLVFRHILFESECYTKVGKKLSIEISAHVEELRGQTLIIGIAREISLRKNFETAIVAQTWEKAKETWQLSEIKKQVLLDMLPDTIIRLNRQGVVLDVRPGVDGYLQKKAREILGEKISDVFPRRIANLTMGYIERAFKNQSMQTYDYETTVEGVCKVWEIRLVVCEPNEVLAIIRDITEIRVREKQLKYLSLHDSLTGIYNRAFIEQEMYRIQHNSKEPVSVIMCDVDRLKQVNDTMGHSSGDNMLVIAAGLIKKAVRRGDIVARIGGDEFAILLPGGNLAAAKSIYERIKKGVALYNAQNSQFPISMSVGYAASSSGSKVSVFELLREADLNMYREKIYCCKNKTNVVLV